MKALIYMCMSLAALAMLSSACAPKDKRFQTKTFINKDGKKTGDGDQQKPVPVGPRGIQGSAVANLNPSGITETMIIANIEKLETTTGDKFEKDLNLTVTINLVAYEGDKIVQEYELLRSQLDKVSPTSSVLHTKKSLEISKENLNTQMRLISETSESKNVKFEVAILSTIENEKDNSTDIETIGSTVIETKEITKDGKKVEVLAEGNLKLTATLKSSGVLRITEGLIKDSGTLICSFIDGKGNTSQLLEVSDQAMKLSEASEIDGKALDFDMSSTQLDNSSHKISEDKNTEVLLSVSPDKSVTAKLSLKKEKCEVPIEIGGSQISADLSFVNETVSNNIYGCCIEKSKLQSGSPEPEETM